MLWNNTQLNIKYIKMKIKTKLWKSKTVLVTGGAGIHWSTIVKRLLNSGDIVHVLDDLSTGSLENLPKHPNLYFHHGSIMNKQFVESLKEIEFDMLFHLASIVGMRFATKYHKLVYDTCNSRDFKYSRYI